MAEEALGTRFDVRRFHAVLLDAGPVMLPMLREQTEAWIAAQAAATAA
jgi:uncharacterized protein (DUF885 family)